MRKNNKIKMLKKIIICGIIFSIICGIVFSLMVYDVRKVGGEYILKNGDNIPAGINNIIVLGAGIKGDGTPSDILKDRLSTTIEVLEKSNCEKVLVSGDHGKSGYNEVGAMKKELMSANIDEKNIFMDHAGFSTYETMYRAKEIFKVDKAIIITNEYHLPRAIYLARKFGIEAYGIPSDVREYYNIESYEKRELLAQAKDFVYVNILRPEPTFLGEEIPISTSDGRETEDEI